MYRAARKLQSPIVRGATNPVELLLPEEEEGGIQLRYIGGEASNFRDRETRGRLIREHLIYSISVSDACVGSPVVHRRERTYRWLMKECLCAADVDSSKEPLSVNPFTRVGFAVNLNGSNRWVLICQIASTRTT